MNENWIPWLISGASLIIVFLTYLRTGRKDEKQEDKESTQIIHGIKEGLLKANMKLDQVCATTNETRTDIKALNNDLQRLDKRVCLVENKLETAFKQIDELKESN